MHYIFIAAGGIAGAAIGYWYNTSVLTLSNVNDKSIFSEAFMPVLAAFIGGLAGHFLFFRKHYWNKQLESFERGRAEHELRKDDFDYKSQQLRTLVIRSGAGAAMAAMAMSRLNGADAVSSAVAAAFAFVAGMVIAVFVKMCMNANEQ